MPTDPEPRAMPMVGDRVRIPKGAYISTTHPAGDRIAKRSQVVTVKMIARAYEDHRGKRRPATVTWTGTGGYWCDAWEWERTEDA